MEILLVLLPALLVVVVGYSVVYTLWEAAGLPGDPETAGWITGFLLLAVVTGLLLSWRRRVRRRRRRT
ncbi:hypothetical protein [Blastococcus saxobsidens]|uniref:Uncharacterized protein n=1 Tax=Blastococcus saxobsidens (strain DD2) TaxID=1146883 RepID=H6RM59_BLASD|nr:hypothetical protein [Blastococcus saxobsidens]CCG01301.1 conserved protein of unknown function [Blastococcus saxobsidens DD2]